MKFFLDTEFIERGSKFPVTLISIGVVSDNGDTFYAESSEWSVAHCSQWIIENVLPHLKNDSRIPVSEIGRRLKDWVARVGGDSKPEFWGYYADYDWVVTAQMFGTMMDLPKGWPMYCNDIKQLCGSLGNPKLPEQGKGEHNALADAFWNRKAYYFLDER